MKGLRENMGIIHRGRSGFTIVELMVVIAVLGILVAIVVVAYPRYLEQTHDNERKSDLSQLAAAFEAYALQKNDFVESGSGCGAFGDGNGWLSAGPEDVAAYPKSIVACLKDAKVITKESDFIDPSGCTHSGGSCGGVPVQAYMKVTCQKGGAEATYLLAHLETQPRKDSEIDALCDSGTVAGFNTTSQQWGTNYGMNYYVRVD